MSDEGTPTPFAEMPVAHRVFAVEAVRARLYELSESIGHPLEPDPPLSKQGESWLRRMRSALCDTECTTASVVEMDKAMHEALSEAEDEQIHSRLIEFEAIRDGIPLAASNAEQALPAVLERIRQMAEA